jgi:hypothetical protein
MRVDLFLLKMELKIKFVGKLSGIQIGKFLN